MEFIMLLLVAYGVYLIFKIFKIFSREQKKKEVLAATLAISEILLRRADELFPEHFEQEYVPDWVEEIESEEFVAFVTAVCKEAENNGVPVPSERDQIAIFTMVGLSAASAMEAAGGGRALQVIYAAEKLAFLYHSDKGLLGF